MEEKVGDTNMAVSNNNEKPQLCAHMGKQAHTEHTPVPHRNACQTGLIEQERGSLAALNAFSKFDTAHGSSVCSHWAQLDGKTYAAHLTKNKFTLSDKQDFRTVSVTSIRNGKV